MLDKWLTELAEDELKKTASSQFEEVLQDMDIPELKAFHELVSREDDLEKSAAVPAGLGAALVEGGEEVAKRALGAGGLSRAMAPVTGALGGGAVGGLGGGTYGALSGGMGAAMQADEGRRWDAFKQGLTEGARTGAITGAGTGAALGGLGGAATGALGGGAGIGALQGGVLGGGAGSGIGWMLGGHQGSSAPTRRRLAALEGDKGAKAKELALRKAIAERELAKQGSFLETLKQNPKSSEIEEATFRYRQDTGKDPRSMSMKDVRQYVDKVRAGKTKQSADSDAEAKLMAADQAGRVMAHNLVKTAASGKPGVIERLVQAAGKRFGAGKKATQVAEEAAGKARAAREGLEEVAAHPEKVRSQMAGKPGGREYVAQAEKDLPENLARARSKVEAARTEASRTASEAEKARRSTGRKVVGGAAALTGAAGLTTGGVLGHRALKKRKEEKEKTSSVRDVAMYLASEGLLRSY